jgi:hypothetical protein
MNHEEPPGAVNFRADSARCYLRPNAVGRCLYPTSVGYYLCPISFTSRIISPSLCAAMNSSR